MAATVREVTYDLLRQLGLTTIFGNPGSTEETFLRDFPADFTYVLGLQEASVMGMADGYAQATGQPVLVNLHTGAGLGNAIGNLIGAALNKTPLIVTAGQQTRQMALMEPYLTNVQAIELPRPWVKWSYEPVRAEDIPAALMRAYATAVQPAKGPVFLSLPMDDWEKPAAGSHPVVRTLSQRVAPDPARLQEFADLIGQAKNPVLLLGGALDRAGGWEAARQLAEKLNVPVWTAPSPERMAFAEDHPLFQGILPFAIGPLSEKLQGHDLLVVIGAPVFRYYPYIPGDFLPAGARLLHITNDAAEAARAPVGDSLVADTRLAAELLTQLVAPGHYPAVPRRVVQRALPSPAATPLVPAEVFATLQDNRPDNLVLVQESMSNLAEFHKWLPITQPSSYFSFASGGLGWALPAAVGLALGERHTGRHRPVMAILGDGATNYSIQALWTAAQHALPVVFVVLCNQEYGILKAFADEQHTPNVPGLDIPGLDFVALATGYGCAAFRVATREALAEAVQAAWARQGPTVLEVPITRELAPLL